MPRITRRKLLSRGAQAIAAGGSAFAAVPILATRVVWQRIHYGRAVMSEASHRAVEARPTQSSLQGPACPHFTSFKVPNRSGTWKLSRIGARQAM